MPSEEPQRLDHAFHHQNETKLQDPILIVRLDQRGQTHPNNATHPAIASPTVQRWLNAWLDKGLSRWRRRRTPQRRPAIPETLAKQVRRWRIDGPAAQGLDRVGWIHTELADPLLKTTGVRTRRAAGGRFGRKIGIRLYRPRYRCLRGDPFKQEQARQDSTASR